MARLWHALVQTGAVEYLLTQAPERAVHGSAAANGTPQTSGAPDRAAADAYPPAGGQHTDIYHIRTEGYSRIDLQALFLSQLVTGGQLCHSWGFGWQLDVSEERP
jgi:hypothetical protein